MSWKHLKPGQRGHRPRLSPGEDTVRYTIRVTASLKKLIVEAGAGNVRNILQKNLPKLLKKEVLENKWKITINPLD